MEELLTQMLVAVGLLSFSYVAGSLALYSHQRFIHVFQFQSKRKSQSKSKSMPSTTLVVEPAKPAKRSRPLTFPI